MKTSIFKKFILLYALVGVIGFLLITYICYSIDYHALLSEYQSQMHQKAVNISKDYANSYFSNEKLRLIETEMNTVAHATGEQIIFLDTTGRILIDTNRPDIIKKNVKIENFDYTVMGNNYFQTGDFYKYFTDDVLSVISPVTDAYTIKGYVTIHVPISYIKEQVYTTFNTNYVSFLIMMLLILLFVIFYFVQIHKPLKKITLGVNEYAKGNFSYRINLNPGDELHTLGESLNYMSNEIYEMDQFQQKFISNISHDFRSPLTSIHGYLGAISDGTIPYEMQQKYINIIIFETERLTKLTNNLLTLNDLNPKSVRLNYSDFDINDIIRHTIETFEGTCKDKHISFKLTFEAKSLLVNGDCEKIQQVIYNLIDNAIKFSHQNSDIFITTNTKNEKAFISVKDTGVGIPKDSIRKIWDRFYKTDNSRGKDKKGSGLGLSIVKEIIIAHGENIDVISTEGVGTEFVFTVKLTKSKTN